MIYLGECMHLCVSLRLRVCVRERVLNGYGLMARLNPVLCLIKTKFSVLEYLTHDNMLIPST